MASTSRWRPPQRASQCPRIPSASAVVSIVLKKLKISWLPPTLAPSPLPCALFNGEEARTSSSRDHLDLGAPASCSCVAQPSHDGTHGMDWGVKLGGEKVAMERGRGRGREREVWGSRLELAWES